MVFLCVVSLDKQGGKALEVFLWLAGIKGPESWFPPADLSWAKTIIPEELKVAPRLLPSFLARLPVS